MTLVAANVALAAPPACERIDVETAAELARAVGRGVPGCHVLLMAAALADFRPRPGARREDLARGRRRLELHLEPTEDVLAGLARARRDEGQTLVGFAAETGAEAIDRAREKLDRKAVDARGRRR